MKEMEGQEQPAEAVPDSSGASTAAQPFAENPLGCFLGAFCKGASWLLPRGSEGLHDISLYIPATLACVVARVSAHMPCCAVAAQAAVAEVQNRSSLHALKITSSLTRCQSRG